MSPATHQPIYLVTLMTIVLTQIVTGLHMELSPKIANELITKEANIKCLSNGSLSLPGQIVSMRLSKKGEDSFVSANQTSFDYGKGITGNMKAEGYISKVNTTESYLSLTIKDPNEVDTGTYVCQLFYMSNNTLEEGRVEANLTVSYDSKLVIRHLLKLLSKLEKTAKRERERAMTREKKIRNIQKQTRQLQRKVQNLKKQAMQQEKKIAKLEEQINQMEIKGTFTSAFSAMYDGWDKMVDGRTLRYRNVGVNIGQHYNSTTGIYTAPKRGVYLFCLSAMTFSGHARIQLKSNDEVVSSLFAGHISLQEQTALTATASLEAGDKVRPVVLNHGGEDFLMGSNGVFGGHLVQLL